MNDIWNLSFLRLTSVFLDVATHWSQARRMTCRFSLYGIGEGTATMAVLQQKPQYVTSVPGADGLW